MSTDNSKGLPDFVRLRQQYDMLGRGQQAEMRRVGEPDGLSFTPALYRLFPGSKPEDRHRRVAFLLPWCKQATVASQSLGKQLASNGISEMRVLQVARARPPHDLVRFRELIMRAEPLVDWATFGRLLWFWEPSDKRRIVEDYFIAQFDQPKGDKK